MTIFNETFYNLFQILKEKELLGSEVGSKITWHVFQSDA